MLNDNFAGAGGEVGAAGGFVSAFGVGGGVADVADGIVGQAGDEKPFEARLEAIAKIYANRDKLA